MEKLDIIHHNFIILLIILVVFVTGIFFGVRISEATRGTDGMMIIVFALAFLSIAMQFILFSRLTHIGDEIDHIHTCTATKLINDKQTSDKQSTEKQPVHGSKEKKSR